MSEKRSGQFSVGLLSIGVVVTIASIGAFFSQSNRIGSVEARTSVLESQNVEINKKLDRIINILDKSNRSIEISTTTIKIL